MLGNLGNFVRRSWPGKCSTFPSFVEEQEPVPFPKKSLDPITALSTKQEQGVRFKRIQMVVTFDDVSKPGDTFSKVGVSANYDEP